MKSHRLDPDPCPWCGYTMDACTNLTGKGGPGPGDITLCLVCASPLQFDADKKLAKITDAEIRKRLDADAYTKFMQARRLLLAMDRSGAGGTASPWLGKTRGGNA